MCGIAGSVHATVEVDDAITERQLRTVAHRGPDSSGVYRRGRGAIGQNRLAVIDLETGDPPITSEDGQLGAVLNGEIYNFALLREELAAAGHRFATKGDTEVIAHLSEGHDPAVVARRLDGMFAFATWDATAGRLTLGRDRFGKKPLYWWFDGSELVFGSEIKTVLAHPSVARDLDEHVLPDYLRFGYVPTPRTFFRGIQSIPPGHVLTWDGSGPPLIEAYWRLELIGRHDQLDVSLGDAGVLVRGALSAAVSKRLVSDVPLGAFLSGGIDSSAIAALMCELSGVPPRTFTIGFEDDDGFDERGYARQVAEHLGTEHTEFVVHPHAIDLVDRLVHHYDQPFGDSSAIPTWALSELTRDHVTVALCGDGGDELFAGYERFAAGVAAHRLSVVPAAIRRAGARVPVPARAGSLRRFLEASADPMPDPFLRWISYVDGSDVRALTGVDGAGIEDYRRSWAETAGAPPLNRLLALNIRTYLLDDLLPKVDRTSMAHALEVRAPFLDDELLDLAMRLPPRLKQRGLSLKRVLKEAMRGTLPDTILDRPKRGFGVPLDRWFRSDLAVLLEDRLGAGARIRAHLEGAAIDRILAEHRSGTRSHGHALWTLLTLELFLRREGW